MRGKEAVVWGDGMQKKEQIPKFYQPMNLTMGVRVDSDVLN